MRTACVLVFSPKRIVHGRCHAKFTSFLDSKNLWLSLFFGPEQTDFFVAKIRHVFSKVRHTRLVRSFRVTCATFLYALGFFCINFPIQFFVFCQNLPKNLAKELFSVCTPSLPGSVFDLFCIYPHDGWQKSCPPDWLARDYSRISNCVCGLLWVSISVWGAAGTELFSLSKCWCFAADAVAAFPCCFSDKNAFAKADFSKPYPGVCIRTSGTDLAKTSLPENGYSHCVRRCLVLFFLDNKKSIKNNAKNPLHLFAVIGPRNLLQKVSAENLYRDLLQRSG